MNLNAKAYCENFSFDEVVHNYPVFENDTDRVIKDTISDTLVNLNSDTIISDDAIKSTINYFAKDSIPIDFDSNIITLYGDAWITFEDIKLEAAKIKFDWQNDLIYAEGIYDTLNNYIGSPVFNEGETEYKAKEIIYNFKSKKGKLYKGITKEGEGYIHGEIVKKDSNNVICAKKAQYTTCEHEDPHFYISANKIKIIPDKNIITGPAYLVIEDVPLPIGIPFGFFPGKNQRSSGIKIPTYGESLELGFFFKDIGYYLGFSDYFDLLIMGDIYTRGSWKTNLKSNYKKRYKYNGSIHLDYAKFKFGLPEEPNYRESTDFSIKWTHRQDPKARPNSSFSANVNAGSKNSLKYASTNPSEIVTNTLSSSISYNKTFAGTPFTLGTSLSHSQNLTTKKVGLTLPKISFNMRKIFPFKSKKAIKKVKWYDKIGISYGLNFRNSIDTYDSLLLEAETWDNLKNGISHSIPISTSIKILKYFTFTPSINYTGRTYFDKIERTYKSKYDTSYHDSIVEEKITGIFHANEFNFRGGFSTRVYGMFKINKFGLIAIRHLMTPNISFVYSPDFSDPGFNIYKKVQKDSIGGIEIYSQYRDGIYGSPGRGQRGSINFSLQNNLEAKLKSKSDTTQDTRKVKLLESFSISGSYNMLADSMKLSMIPITARTNLFKNKFSIQFSCLIDPYYLRPDSVIVDEFEVTKSGSLGRLKNARITCGVTLAPKPKKESKSENSKESSIGLIADNYYLDFSIPWSLSFNYSLNYTKYRVSSGKTFEDPKITQSLSFRGNLSLTPKWKITFGSGYDLENKEFTITNIGLTRDLHCWEMSLTTIPFGTYRTYMFQINVRSSVLKDLKYDKKKSFYDY